ncbi:MAG: nucleotide exchange factor GrpE [Desulfobulbus propionicus]|nr:MAG: nucleotide exchange factor GrpE [Desulfobulbus propionicus]
MVDEVREGNPEEEQEVSGGDEQQGSEEPTVEATPTAAEELAETKDRLLRVAAEFENYKKRMERERSRLLKYAGEAILKDLLTTLDNLDRAVEQGKAASADTSQKLEAMLEGLDLTRKGLVSTLERYEVAPLTAVGQPFNPDEHDALTMEASDEIPANHVLKEYARGYMFKDRVLRHAQVVVSSGPAGE